MRVYLKTIFPFAAALMFVPLATSQTTVPVARRDVTGQTVLYGTAYYNEYNPQAAEPARLATDIAMMKAAGFNVVRMGESTWSLWEPADGQFEFSWMDRVVTAMNKAGIKVILGTPTYSIPVWMYQEHPEILARPLGGGYVGYGMRQNMDYDNPEFRRHAERLITKLVRHYRNNPGVIGWQIDNETGSNGASNPDVFHEFVERLKREFGTPETLNKAWFLNYWGQDVYRWEDMPTRDNASSPSYKLEWSRFQQDRVTAYLAWQAQLVRENSRADQFVTTDFASMMRPDVNEERVSQSLDVVADNVYHGWQDHYTGEFQMMQGDFSRSLKHGGFLVTETNAQTLGWDSAAQYPPYDGQLRLDAYTFYSTGADMVEYWHWSSIEAGQETYWGGVLGHDLEPNRAYREVSRIGSELRRIGPEIVNLHKQNQVAILYSVDSSNAISFMPFEHQKSPDEWTPGREDGEYTKLLQQMHTALYNANVDVDFVFPDEVNFSKYKLLIVPALYISDDALLKRLAEYVHKGGHILMTFKSGFANENSAVRWERAPGPLRNAAGFTYQEYSSLDHPLSLKGDPFHVDPSNNTANTWVEFLQLTTAKPLAFYDHPFFGQWPAITRNSYGAGSLTYEGTELSDGLQDAVILAELKNDGLTGPDQELPAAIRVQHGTNQHGKILHYFFNYSSTEVSFHYAYGAGTDLLTGQAIRMGQNVVLKPWDLIIAAER